MKKNQKLLHNWIIIKLLDLKLKTYLWINLKTHSNNINLKMQCYKINSRMNN